jgi:hypothetical protein
MTNLIAIASALTVAAFTAYPFLENVETLLRSF